MISKFWPVARLTINLKTRKQCYFRNFNKNYNEKEVIPYYDIKTETKMKF